MKRAAVILLGIGFIITGSLLLIKDRFGDSIEATAEAVAVNAVAIKMKASKMDFTMKSWGSLF